jgi:hypothetical protein
MQQLQPTVIAQHSGHHGKREVPAELGIDGWPDDIGEAQHRDRHIRPPPGETADVALDLNRILGVPGGR